MIAPCNCSGSMKYVHRDCLRRWRTQGSLRCERMCSVCGVAYKSEWESPVAQALLSYPAASAAALGSALLWAVAPHLQRHLAGAAWMHVAAPLHCCDHWHLWELRSGLGSAVQSWILSGVVLMTCPALLDHLLTAFRGGSPSTRLCELVLFAENFRRLRFLLRLAVVRRSLSTSQGLKAMLDTQDAATAAIEAAGNVGVPYRRACAELLGLCFGPLGLAPAQDRLPNAKGFPLGARCLQLAARWPQQMYVYLKVLGEQLGSRSILQRWLPLLWHLANRDVGQLAVVSDLFLCGPVWGAGAYLARLALPDLDVDSGQIQHAFCNLRDFLCSAVRGCRAVHLLALRLSL